MTRKELDNLYLDDEISKTQRLELDRYQKYLKGIKKYDPEDEDEYLYLTRELGTLINENKELDDVEVLELTRKLEKIEYTEDYTVELLELTKEIKQIIKPVKLPKKKIEIPKIEKKINPRKEQVKSLSATSILPKITNVKKKVEQKKEIPKIEEKKPEEKKEILTFKDLVEQNIKNNPVDHFDTQTIQKIRKTVKRVPEKKKTTSKKEKMAWTTIFFASLLVLVFLIVRFVIWEVENLSMRNQISDIYAMTEVTEVVSSGMITDVDDIPINEEVVIPPPIEQPSYRPSDYWYYMSMSMLDVDFNELKKINNETAGWIQVAGTNVNYPYVHTVDNSFYLNHTFNKSYNGAGWVFLDYRNDPENFGRNSILYAHGRMDNTMFGSLKQIVTPNWYNNSNNYVVKTSNEKENSLWQVFSVYTILPESYYIRTKFNDDEFRTFINTITARSVHDFNIEVDIDDKILTLSTCYDDTKRVVLHAKLIRTEEK